MKRPSPCITALVMTAIYLLVILAPLAPAALHSATLTHLLTGECAGDCRSCGCSPERSAAHACCCWQKKLAGAKALKTAAEHKFCPAATAPVQTKPAGSCCSRSAQHSDHEDEASLSAQATATTDNDTQTISISTRPCSSGKDLTFTAGEKIQHIPFLFFAGIPLQQVTRFAFLQPELLASRSGQPPDPPPKIRIIS